MQKNGDMWAGLFFLFLGVAVIVGSLRMPLGTPLDPQPGFFPLLAGVFLSGLSIVHLALAFHKRKGSSKIQAFGTVWRPASMIAGLLIYSFILDPVGYVIATIFLSVIILRILESKSWWKLVTISIGASIGTYVLFDRIMGVTLPLGILKGVL
jgi:putative tricarboxylic transport membrane protein